MLKMERKKLEEMLKLAVKQHVAEMPAVYEGTFCLSNETLFALYEGNISENDRKQAINHLAKCKSCCTDVETYIDLMESKKGKESS